MSESSRLVYSTEHAVERKEHKDKGARKAGPGGQKQSGEQQLRVQLEKKGRGGKTVSVISGLGMSPRDLEKTLKQLKAKLGTGGTVKDNTLEIQGDHCNRIMALLQEMGLKPKRSGGQ